ncbi:ATP-binding protein [Pseudactinotalea sp. Z1732]|uniref:ATP-binding protein n=1 Tax=Pseudactinotalea sp. Z1732 TaxID=3413026 RepID=UPI003C7B78EC
MSATLTHTGQWRLERLEVVNWGTFHGHHRIGIPRKGYLLTGHSGSGKSSLVDAIAAVLVPRGKLRFNAAAADGATRRADRTTLSYIRGAWRRHADEESGEVVSDYLRRGATWSGILLRYSDGTGNSVTLVKLYHLRRGANTPAEATELHVLSQEPVDLPDFEPYVRGGLEVRRIKSTWPQALVTNRHSVFSARFCRQLGIAGENALVLLHKTQGAKSLDNLDDLFRTFMLDEPPTRALANTAVEQFADLSQAHAHVVEARTQVEVLTPLTEYVADHDQRVAAAQQAEGLRTALAPFRDTWKHALAEEARTQARSRMRSAEHDLQAATAATAEARSDLDLARQVVAERGGSALEMQRLKVEGDELRLAAARTARDQLAGDLAQVGVAMPTSFDEFTELQSTARREADRAKEAEAVRREQAEKLHDEAATLRGRKRAIDTELKALRGVRSNLDARLLAARDLLCRATGLSPSFLPFAGELLQVRGEHAEWTGAIERVLRPLATVLLVPATHRERVTAAVDAHHLGTRLSLESVPAQTESPRPVRTELSLVHRVEVAEGPMAPWLHATLSRSYDYACVDSAGELHEHDRAVTRAGQVKRGRTRYEKDDRSRIDDRSRWVLGFDNAAKVELFLEGLRQVHTELDQINGRLGRLAKEQQVVQARAWVLERLERREWSAMDVPGAEDALARSSARLEELRAGNTDLHAAELEAERAKESVRQAEQAEQVQRDALAHVKAELEAVQKVLAEIEPTPGAVPVAHQEELEHRFHAARTRRTVTYDTIDRVATTVSAELVEERDAAVGAARRAEGAITAIARDFRGRWPALAADLTGDVADRGGYLQILHRLQADRLPEFEDRFFDLLEQQSQRNVVQLANQIRRAPQEIRDRIAPVNASLRRSPFDVDRFLDIKVTDNRSAAAKEFLADLKTITTGSWGARDRADAEAAFEVMSRIMGRLASSEHADRTWQDLCLDTRKHVRFIAREIDEEARVLAVHDSGSGLSGGQKQKLVVFCLAAALRYQLADEGQDLPRFGTVVLDEAFDKADTAFTSMAMDIFREFGFHMILATPLKLLQTLEEYVGGIGLATCTDRKQSTVGVVGFDDVAALAGAPYDRGEGPEENSAPAGEHDRSAGNGRPARPEQDDEYDYGTLPLEMPT